MCNQLTLDFGWVEPAAPQHDAWKRWRKQFLPSDCYATDIDAVLVDRHGPIALVEFKTPKHQELTYTQQVFFDEAVLTGWSVYRVTSEKPFRSFLVEEYVGGGVCCEVMRGTDADYRAWEVNLRRAAATEYFTRALNVA